MLARPAHEIGDDKKVARVIHRYDDIELVGEALAVGLGRRVARGFVHARGHDLAG